MPKQEWHKSENWTTSFIEIAQAEGTESTIDEITRITRNNSRFRVGTAKKISEDK
jgi:hypothetical protein